MNKKWILPIRVGNKEVGYNLPVFIIAEAGVNHNGRLDLALKLVDAAKDAGADAIKFQTFKAEQIVVSGVPTAAYQKENTGKNENQTEMLKRLELKEEFYASIIEHCKKRNIIFFSTPHGGFESVDFLVSLNAPVFKFGSGDLTNLPVLEYAARFKKPIILSTGMAKMHEIKEAVQVIKKENNDKIIILHCTTNYPCALEEVNLNAMTAMMKELNVLVGYSDHTLGGKVSLIAVALGACLIEKHLTLDKNLEGPDHKASADFEEFKEMAENIRLVPVIKGSCVKTPTKSELELIKIVRKSVVAIADINKGEEFGLLNIDIKRPADGLPPKYFNKILGKKAARDIKTGECVSEKEVKGRIL